MGFYRQHLKSACKLCAPVHLKVGGLSYGKLLPLSLGTAIARRIFEANSSFDVK